MSALIQLKMTLSELHEFLVAHRVGYAIVVKEFCRKIDLAKEPQEQDMVIMEARKVLLAGMGSLNDVWISKDNQHIVEDEESANRELERYREQLRKLLLGNLGGGMCQ